MNCVKLLVLVIVSGLFSVAVNAQTAVPTPAPVQSQPIALKGATLHIGDGQVIDNGVLVFDKGKITAVGKWGTVNLPENTLLIDVSGQQIYPGLIAPNTTLGIAEIDQARPTNDNNEIGWLNPTIRSCIAFNTDSKIIPTVRTNGILTAQVVPQGGMVSGQSSIMQLDAWNWEDAVYKMDEGLHINWPSMTINRNAEPNAEDPNTRWKEQVNELYKLFNDAKAYVSNPIAPNLKLQALQAALNAKQKVYIHLQTVKEMMAAIAFIHQFKLDAVFVDAEEAFLATNLLKENNIPVIISSTHALPIKNDDDIQQPYKTPVELYKAGVLFCFSHKDWSGNQRNLAFQAGTAVAYGLPEEEAIKALTANTAKILGIDKQVGTLTVGKDATIVVSIGNLLDMKSAVVTYAFIQGRQLQLKNHQQALYEKYKAKYEDQKK